MLIIGIAGGTGCGKTTVVEQIMNELPEGEVGIISQDSYYKDTSDLSYEERVKINFDHPKSIDFDLLSAHIQDLKAGSVASVELYKSGRQVDQYSFSLSGSHNAYTTMASFCRISAI